MPEDLQQYLDEYLEVYSSEEGTKIISDILQKKDHAMQNIDEFVENH